MASCPTYPILSSNNRQRLWQCRRRDKIFTFEGPEHLFISPCNAKLFSHTVTVWTPLKYAAVERLRKKIWKLGLEPVYRRVLKVSKRFCFLTIAENLLGVARVKCQLMEVLWAKWLRNVFVSTVLVHSSLPEICNFTRHCYLCVLRSCPGAWLSADLCILKGKTSQTCQSVLD